VTPDSIRKKFTGYEKDTETGLNFAEARYYNNEHGRFTAVDPLLASGKSANPQSFNRYVYVGNNPLTRIDPYGKDWWETIDKQNGSRHMRWFDDDPDEDRYEVLQRWDNYLYKANDNKWYALDPNSGSFDGFYEFERAYWQYGEYADFNGEYDGFVYDMLSVKDGVHMLANIKTGDVDGSLYYFGKISITNGVSGGLTKGICGRGSSLTTLGLSENVAERTATALVPKAASSLGKWGEARLAQVLNNTGFKPSKAAITSTGVKRYFDRLVNRVAHEAKAGLNAKLDSTARRQILADKQLIDEGIIDGAHWHFFQGASQEIMDFLNANEIPFTIH
jgi:RHS repeat-associated protein